MGRILVEKSMSYNLQTLFEKENKTKFITILLNFYKFQFLNRIFSNNFQFLDNSFFIHSIDYFQQKSI